MQNRKSHVTNEMGRPGGCSACRGSSHLITVAVIMLVGAGFAGCDDCEQGQPTYEQSSKPPGLPEPAEVESGKREAPPARPQGAPGGQPAAPGAPEGGAAAPDRPQGPPGAPEPGTPPSARPQGPQGQPGTAAAESVSDAEIESFADIQMELAIFQQELAQRAQAGGDQQKLQRELQQKAGKVIQDSDLSAERFNEVAGLVQNNTDLQNRVRSMIEKKMKDERGKQQP